MRKQKFWRTAPPILRVHDLGVELHAIEAPGFVGDGGEGRGGASGDRREAGRQGRHLVAVAHPDRHLLADPERPVEERRFVQELDRGPAELAGRAGQDLAAELRAHRLLAVADAEDRHAELEDGSGRPGAGRLVGRGRSAGQDDGRRLEPADMLVVERAGMDLAIDPELAQAAGDQLRILRAEVENQDALGHLGPVRSGAGRF